MKRTLAAIAGTAVAVALLLLVGVFFHLSDDRETAESAAAGSGRKVADREDREAGPSAEARADRGEQREVPGTPGGEPQGPPGDPAEFREWMKSRDWAEFEAWAAEDLRAQFGETIEETRNQIALLELRRFLKENFPEDWETKLEDLLYRAFPDAAGRILTTFGRMDSYDEWLVENKFDLAALQEEEIREALWQKREEIFGEDASEIWGADSESAHLRDLLEILEEADDIPLKDRVRLFRSAADESGPAGADPLLQDKSHIMTLAFLSSESVQAELRQMSTDERAESLRQIRRSMGIDEESIEVLEQLDAERERRWQNGLRYMEERNELAEDYEGAALEEELHFLRERYFGDDAKTIEAEETSGFFRFERRRVYGRN
jgi:transcriptional regulator of met regulon